VAVRTDGTLWAWGYNGDGELGDGTTADKSSPVQIGSATNWQSVAAGAYHTVAVRTDRTLWAWGENESGQLGDGTTESTNSPAQIGSATNWQTVAAGDEHTVAVRTDGTLWAWGDNENGQLGDGTGWRVIPGKIGAPVILVHPASLTNGSGTTAIFGVTASGSQPLVYQWRKDGTNLADGGNFVGVATSDLTLAAVQSSDQGEYNVVVTNSYGSVTSSVAILTVQNGGNPPLPAYLTTAGRLVNGSFQFAFTNSNGALFSVLASTNPALPVSNWAVLSNVTEISPGQFQFTDPEATNSRQRFYRVRSP
jgi:hypothetical protein